MVFYIVDECILIIYFLLLFRKDKEEFSFPSPDMKGLLQS